VTELAYLANGDAAYTRRFTATVRALPPGAVVLDRTYFYPAGGGQPGDRGRLRVADDGESPEVPVVDVARAGASVLHRIAKPRGGAPGPGLAVGRAVEGEIDWERRYAHMRLHTAQHLASARAFALAGLRTRRAVMAGVGATIDLEGPWPATLAIEDFHRDIARRVTNPLAVRVRFVPRAEWEREPASGRSGLVPLPPNVDPVRVIDIEEADVCPCGGTHLRSTGEIGELAFEPVETTAEGAGRLRFRLEPATGPAPATPRA
jgi:misacylated tRNA(Ala) deacylase